MTTPAWLRGNHNLQWLMAVRVLRSVAQGFLSVVVPLYIAALGFSTISFGSLLTLAGLGSAVMTLGLGLTGDRYGRRRPAIVISVLAVIGTAGFALTHSFAVLALMSILSTFGRGGGAGAGASWGPLYPALQPLVAGACSDRDRNDVFAALSVAGAIAGAIGSALAIIPAWLHGGGMGWVPSYRVMFWLGAALAVLGLLAMLRVREQRRPASKWEMPSRQTLSILGRLSLTNVVNGLGMGLLGPLLTYWFYVRYGAGPAELGTLYTIANALSILPYLGAPALARRMGAVAAVTWTRIAASLMLCVQALCPTFLLAAVVYLVRVQMALVSMPIRQSFVMGVTEERSRSVVSAFSGLPAQLASAASPSIGTYFMESWTIDAPLWLGAVAQVANAVMYFALLRREVPPEERIAPVAADAATLPAAGEGPGG
jgi:MFS family permease